MTDSVVGVWSTGPSHVLGHDIMRSGGPFPSSSAYLPSLLTENYGNCLVIMCMRLSGLQSGLAGGKKKIQPLLRIEPVFVEKCANHPAVACVDSFPNLQGIGLLYAVVDCREIFNLRKFCTGRPSLLSLSEMTRQSIHYSRFRDTFLTGHYTLRLIQPLISFLFSFNLTLHSIFHFFFKNPWCRDPSRESNPGCWRQRWTSYAAKYDTAHTTASFC